MSGTTRRRSGGEGGAHVARCALALGLLFAWLLLVPLEGPALARSPLPELGGLAATELFVLTHSLTLLSLGVAAWRRRPLPPWARWSGTLTGALGLLLALTPHPWWPLLLAAAAPAGAAVLAVAAAIARLPWQERSWAIALGAALANVPLFLAVLLGDALPVRALGAVAALGPLVLPLLLAPGAAEASPPAVPARPPLAILPGVFAAYLVGGLTYAVILPSLRDVGSRIGVLPYVVCSPVAAWVANRWGRGWGIRAGLATLGGGFSAWALTSGLSREVVGHGLVLAGYAFLDVSLWALFADHRGSPIASFGFGLGAMTMGIFAGMTLSDRWAITTQGQEAEAALVAAVALLAAAVLIPVQARGHPAAAHTPPLSTSLHGPDGARLSRREAEVVALAARALTNKEIARVTGLSEGTVRKHLERAYRKLGIRSRVEAVALLRDQGWLDHEPPADRNP